MNDDELKNLWQRQPLRNAPIPSTAQLVSAMQNQMSQFRRTIYTRDFGELAACAVVIIVFGFFAYNEQAPIARLGYLIVAGSAIFIAWKLVHTRRSNPPAPPGATTIQSLRAELNAVRAQSRLLKSVLWWYLLPPGIGLLVATWGMRVNLHAKIPATLFYIGLYAFIYWLNQWARSKQILPVQAQLESLLRSAETGEPLDQTRVAGLRPIALSMAAAEQIKPVEFKVAFWQIAIYGEIGFIGIWFFLMIGLTMGNQDWSTKDQAPRRFQQPVPAEETNRYPAVARKVIDLFNAGNYAVLQDLYDPEMSKAFPPKETSEFYTGLAANFGRIENFEGPIGSGDGEWTPFLLHCQHGDLAMSLALDSDDKIAGILFKPARKPFPNFGSLFVRIFSWQHLLWIVPFFLGGLVYSWLMQKMTERAVGISALGVHLQKGLNLILWDEIKEVRPLKVLNIRSLWLIRESGEKTILAWTGLERHGDLKAAVERFAPADHPIREYLRLL